MTLAIRRTKPEDAQTERYLIVAMIMSDNVCRNLYDKYRRDFFQAKLTKEVSQWCIDFFRKYDTAPKQEIQAVYEMKSKSGKIDPDLEEEIEKFLENLSQEYEEWEDFNEQYYVDTGWRYFKKRNFQILCDQLREAADEGDVEEAEKRLSNFTKISETLSTARVVTSPEGTQKLKESFENRPPELFRMPGALGSMIGPIERETFIALLGREKVGKTFYLMMFAIAAARVGLNVAMIETGDLTQDQLDIRFNSYFTRKVAREYHAGVHYVPVMDCLLNQKNECKHSRATDLIVRTDDKGHTKFGVDIYDPDVLNSHERCIECWKDRFLRPSFKGSIWWEQQNIDVWNWHEARKATTQFSKRFKGKIVTEAFPMRTVKASDIRNWCINKQQQEGFIPDLLIVDYPDILLPENDSHQYRHQENEKWMILREISQEFHNCVLVVTQADADSYNKDTLKLSNYTEDKRKYGHTTHFLAINKTELEERYGCSRISTLLLRENSVKVTQQATILQNLATAEAHKASFFGRVPSV
jgi:hypothetical protein